MIGNAGIGAWGASSGWSPAAPVPPAQPNVWSTPAAPNMSAQQSNSFFNTSDVWGGSSTTTSNTAFSTTTTTTTSQKKDDVFGDIWGSFK
jgi:stromal membrane-associated protein